MRRAVIVVGKAPVPGAAKTRLVPPLAAEQAAALYRAFLLDTLAVAVDLGWEHAALVHPRGDGPALKALLPAASPVRLLEQPGTGLADALRYAFEHHFAVGCHVVILIGSDTPTLTTGPIRAACAALEQETADLAIGRSADGGYYLIGMRQAHLGVFERIDWSTCRVHAQTLARARRLGLRVHAAPESFDVDEPADLDRLQRELAGGPPGLAPATRATLDRLRVSAPLR
jgi:rSAM/selenodomain-associated transferase 1